MKINLRHSLPGDRVVLARAHGWLAAAAGIGAVAVAAGIAALAVAADIAAVVAAAGTEVGTLAVLGMAGMWIVKL